MQQSHPVMHSSVQLQCVYFVVGCFYARLYFLNRELEELDDFYALTNKWLQQNEARGNELGHMLLVLHMYQANYLRAKRRQQQAIELTEAALKLAGSKQLQSRVDINYRYNLLLQLTAARLELQPVPTQQNPRRALTFNISPEEKPKSLSKTEVKSSKKPAKFTIYTEEVHPFSSSGSSSSSDIGSSPERQSGKRLDLNACQLIEILDLSDNETEPVAKLKPTRSVRSTRTRAQLQVEATLRRTATVPVVTRRNVTPEEKTPSTRLRTRRQQQTAEQQTAAESLSSRRRQRN